MTPLEVDTPEGLLALEFEAKISERVCAMFRLEELSSKKVSHIDRLYYRDSEMIFAGEIKGRNYKANDFPDWYFEAEKIEHGLGVSDAYSIPFAAILGWEDGIGMWWWNSESANDMTHNAYFIEDREMSYGVSQKDRMKKCPVALLDINLASFYRW